MKRFIAVFLAVLVALGLFAATGYAGYRFGYARGAQVITANGEAPRLRPPDDFGPREMPRNHFGFGRGGQRGFGMDSFPMMGFGFFPLLFWLGRVVILALIVWFIYWLFTRSGWRLTRQTTESVPPKTE